MKTPKETHRISFRIRADSYKGLMIAAADAGNLPGPHVMIWTLDEAERGKKMKRGRK